MASSQAAFGRARAFAEEAGLSAPVFEGPAEVDSTDGSALVRWQGGGSGYELETDVDPSFSQSQIRYRGPDSSAFLSGLDDGAYHLRVRALSGDGAGPWSRPLVLRVQHHPLFLALLLFGLGALVFGVTAAVIIRSSRAVGREG